MEFSGADMQMMARSYVDRFAEAGAKLDFTPASFEMVDQLIDLTKREFAKAPPAELNNLQHNASLSIGAYVGEVIRMHEGGAWKTVDGVPVLDLGEHLAPTTMAMLALLVGEPIDLLGQSVTTVVAYYDAVSRLANTWVEAAFLGETSTVAAMELAIADDPTVAQWIASQAQFAVKTAKIQWNALLDFSPATLDVIEGILEQMHGRMKSAPEAIVAVWGGYVGEVVRRHYGGKWRVKDGVLQLEITPTVSTFPMRTVQKRIIEGSAHALPQYFSGFGASLDR